LVSRLIRLAANASANLFRMGLALARTVVRPLLELCGEIEAKLRKRDLRAGNRLPRPRSASPKGGTARERKQTPSSWENQVCTSGVLPWCLFCQNREEKIASGWRVPPSGRQKVEDFLDNVPGVIRAFHVDDRCWCCGLLPVLPVAVRWALPDRAPLDANLREAGLYDMAREGYRRILHHAAVSRTRRWTWRFEPARGDRYPAGRRRLRHDGSDCKR
jgi:hypothetical protein